MFFYSDFLHQTTKKLRKKVYKTQIRWQMSIYHDNYDLLLHQIFNFTPFFRAFLHYFSAISYTIFHYFVLHVFHHFTAFLQHFYSILHHFYTIFYTIFILFLHHFWPASWTKSRCSIKVGRHDIFKKNSWVLLWLNNNWLALSYVKISVIKNVKNLEEKKISKL